MRPKTGRTGNWRYMIIQGEGCQAKIVNLDALLVQRHFSRDLLPDRVHSGVNHICS